MPERNIRISSTQADDLEAVCSLGEAALTGIADALQAAPITIRRERIEEIIEREIRDKEKTRLISRTLFGLATVHRRNFETAESLLDAISLPPRWNEESRTKWIGCRPLLVRLLSSESIMLATKAVDLSFDVERFCVGVRIITDIRPVFDLPRNEVSGSTIRQTMRLEYMTLDGSVSSISIGLDADDIKRLKRACEEAVHKAGVAKAMLTAAGQPEVITPGDDDA